MDRGKRELDVMIRSKKVTVHQIQKLAGLLNFFCRAVVPGRAFTRRLYSKTAGLKSFHHVRVDREMRADCSVWLQFLEMDQAVCRPFMDFTVVLHADNIEYFTDGALDELRLGIGGCYQNCYFSGTLRADYFGANYAILNIQIVELYSVLVSLYLGIHKLANKRVVLFCDNESVVHMLNKTTSSCRVCMIMIRMIVLWSMKFNARIFCMHLRSEQNTAADLLSRGRIQEYLDMTSKNKRKLKETLPQELWPLPPSWLV